MALSSGPKGLGGPPRKRKAGGPRQSLPIASPKTEAVIGEKDNRVDTEKFPES